MYLAFNKAIAVEASEKFPSSVNCSTVHSMAYQNTVKPYGLTIGFFSYRDIRERIPFEIKLLAIEHMERFFTSRFTSIDNYCKFMEDTTENFDYRINSIITKYINLMKDKKIPCTHGFYLKLFHIMLANKKITVPKQDLIMIDEFADSNEVTIEIFRLLDAEKKVGCGDFDQSCYAFNHTVNGFEVMRDEAVSLRLTKSFRVESDIARRIQRFMQDYLDPDKAFIGTTHDNSIIETTAYISRTNSGLISRIITAVKNGEPFNLTRKADLLFKLPLIMISLGSNRDITDPEWKFLNSDIREWKSNQLLQSKQSLRSYIVDLHSDDIAIKSCGNLLAKFSPSEIISAHKYSKQHEKESGHNLTICTSHSFKGGQCDHVTVSDDMNRSLDKIFEDQDNTNRTTFTPNEIQELNLYYICVSRAIKKLSNARHLYTITELDEIEEQEKLLKLTKCEHSTGMSEFTGDA